MENKDIQTSFLVGFHFRKPDFNFKNIYGAFLNEFREIVPFEFDVIEVLIDDLTIILKCKQKPKFELRLSSKNLIFEDDLPFEEFQKISNKIINSWVSISKPSSIMRLIGVMRKVEIQTQPPMGIYNARLLDTYFKNTETLKGKRRLTGFKINFMVENKDGAFNINIALDEQFENNYLLKGSLDVNQLNDDSLTGVGLGNLNKIFDFAQKYYECEFNNFINKIEI